MRQEAFAGHLEIESKKETQDWKVRAPNRQQQPTDTKKNRQALDDVVVAPVSSERRTTTPRRNADSYRRPKVERYPKKPRNIIRTLNNCNMEQYHR